MRCFVETHLDAPADFVWSTVKRPATLLYVTRGFLGFSGIDRLPPEWHEGWIFETRFWFFHIIPALWKHTLSIKQIDENQKIIVSNEQGGFIRTWNHIIRVSPASSGCDYSDEIEIRAGLLTIFVWLYANVFYRYRQARWRKLAARQYRPKKA
jgi:hypothetical protein